jgi:hypothetical protein
MAFNSFCANGSAASPYRSTRHATNNSESSRDPCVLNPGKAGVGGGVFACAPSARAGGATVPGGKQVCEFSQTTWQMIGLEHRNAFAALGPPSLTGPPVTLHVVNLDHRRERWSYIQHLGINHHGVLTERVSALQARRGWIGCARSHIEIIRRAASKKHPFVIVAEDDFATTVDPALWARRLRCIVAALAERPDDWDVFKCMSSGRFRGGLVDPWDATLGIYEVNGGTCTDLIVYNASFYPKVDAWAKQLSVHEAAITDKRASEDPEPMLAWDAWTSTHANRMLTAVPYLTNASADTSDIVTGGQVSGLRAMHAGESVAALWNPMWMATAGESLGNVVVAVVTDTVPRLPCELWLTLESLLGPHLGTSKALVLPVLVVSCDPVLPNRIQRHFGSRVKVVAKESEVDVGDSKYTLRMESGWILRRPLCVQQAVRVLNSDPKVGVVSLRDVNDMFPKCAPVPQATTAVVGGIAVWGLTFGTQRAGVPMQRVGGPAVVRVDPAARLSVLLPGGCAINTIRFRPGQILPSPAMKK